MSKITIIVIASCLVCLSAIYVSSLIARHKLTQELNRLQEKQTAIEVLSKVQDAKADEFEEYWSNYADKGERDEK